MAIKRITTNLIKDSDIATVDIANNAITAAKITDGNITTAKLADLSVTAGKLAATLDLTGKTITVATATTGDNDTSPASTAFVQQEIAALVDSSPDSLNTLNELAAALGDDASFSTTVTNSIATKLPLAGGTMTGDLKVGATIASTGGTTNNRGMLLAHQNNTNQSYVGRSENGVADTGNRITFDYDNDKMQLDSDGDIVLTPTSNVGIGTINPNSTVGKLDIAGSATNYNTSPMITFTDTTGAADSRNWSIGNIAINYGDFHIGCGDSNSDYFDATSHSKFMIDKDGNVGIGTSSPALQSGGTGLHVNGSSYSEIKFTNSSTGTAATDGTALVTNSLDFGINNREAGKLTFGTSNITRMTVDSSGNLLVGTTDTAHYGGSANSGFLIASGGLTAISRSSGTVLYVNRQTSDGDIITLRKDGSAVGSISSDSGNTSYNSNGGVIYLGGDQTNHIKVLTSTATGQARIEPSADNAVNLGQSGLRFKDLYLSGGAYLGGTGSANHLDDYEEGAYTPTITPATSGSVTTNTYTAYAYTKVGRLVTVTGLIRSDSQSSPQGDARISLPFTVANLTSLSGRSFGTVKVVGLSWGTSGYLVAELIEGNDYFTITVCEDNGGQSTLNANLFVSGIDTISVGFQYFTDA